jgi:hypothetical protein
MKQHRFSRLATALSLSALLIASLLSVPAAAGTKAAPSSKKSQASATAKKGAKAVEKSKTKQASNQKKKAAARSTARSEKAEAPSEPAEEKPAPQTISPSVVNALADADLNRAIILMREEVPSPKLNYLLHEATTIVSSERQKKPEKSDAHKVYQNIAIGYHNLYLFLKAQGIEQKKYVDQARKYYGKARHAATLLHKSDCDLLEAALLAASGNREKAAKLYDKADITSMRGDFESTEYLAAYHAAAGQGAAALEALEAAYKQNAERTLTWLAIGDDFASLKDDPIFQAVTITWRRAPRDREFTLSVPKAEHPKLDISEGSGSGNVEGGFAPQKMMVHAKKEEAELARLKKASSSSLHSRSGKRKSAHLGKEKSAPKKVAKQAASSKTAGKSKAPAAKKKSTAAKAPTKHGGSKH